MEEQALDARARLALVEIALDGRHDFVEARLDEQLVRDMDAAERGEAVVPGAARHLLELFQPRHRTRSGEQAVRDDTCQSRAQRHLAIVDAANADMMKMRQSISTHFQETYAVHRRHESTLADYEAQIDVIMGDVHAVELAGMERRFELKETLEPAEYNAVFADIQEEVIKGDKKEAKQDAKRKKKEDRKAAKGK